MILSLLGRPIDAFDLVNDRAGHDMRTRSTGRSCATSWGGDPGTRDFGEGLAATIGWYRANEGWWRPQKAATEAQYARAGQ